MRMIYRRVETVEGERILNGRAHYTLKLVCGHTAVDYLPMRVNCMPSSAPCKECVTAENRKIRLAEVAEDLLAACKEITMRGYIDPKILALIDRVESEPEKT